MRKKNGDKINIFNGKEQWEAKLNLTESIIKPERKTRVLVSSQIFTCILVY